VLIRRLFRKAEPERLRKGGGGLIPLGQRIAHMAPEGRLGILDRVVAV
jgi:hypothetical protein